MSFLAAIFTDRRFPGPRLAVVLALAISTVLPAPPGRAQSRCVSTPATLEDIYGPTGNSFQGALTFINFESDVPTPPVAGYGWGVDDVVVQWREFRLDQDTTDCVTSGSCATVDLITTNVYESEASLAVTVVDTTPYGTRCTLSGRCTVGGVPCTSDGACAADGGICTPSPCIGPADCPQVGESCAASFNDCDGNGHYFDAADGDDCDGDGVRDVIAVATSLVDVVGERLVLDEAEPGSGRFTGSLATSPAIDGVGVLLIQAMGSRPPVVTVVYEDIDDGTGDICRNSIDPAAQGRVLTETLVFVDTVRVLVTAVELVDNGDGDGFPDDHETIEMTVMVSNLSNRDLTNLIVWLSSDDPDVDCVLDAVARVGDLARGEKRRVEDTLTFRVAQVARIDVSQDLTAELRFGFSAPEVSGSDAPQVIALDLDLDASGGDGPGTFFESFESGFGSFTTMHLDAGLGGSTTDGSDNNNSDGYRCQYNDPNWVGSNTYGTNSGQACYLNPTGRPDAFYWQTLAERSYSGTQSLYFGIPLSPELGFTTPLAQLEAVRTTDPINLGWDRVCSLTRSLACTDNAGCPAGESCVRVTPQLSIKHQISLMDGRTLNTPLGVSLDRGVVQVQLADAAGGPVGDWIKVHPYTNLYDQPPGILTNCLFDPIDDGNDEDSFFDPSDPLRRLGPSSTCFPEFSFTWQGNTDDPFHPEKLGCCTTTSGFTGGGRPVEGPGLEGATGLGTWVEPIFDLYRFRGRRIRLRFLETSVKLSSAIDHESIFAPLNPDPGDDGWWIDDVTISDTLAVPATVSVDTKDNAALPGCGAICDFVTARLTSDAAGDRLAAPGRAVRLSAADSTIDSCIGGVGQYRFWIDGDHDHLGGGPADRLLRDWSLNPEVWDAPDETTYYLVEVRCSSDITCYDSRRRIVVVDCPDGPGPGGVFQTITAPDTTRLEWADVADGSFARGDLATVSSLNPIASGPVVGATSLDTSTDVPQSGEGLWYLIKSGGPTGPFCNAATWRSGGIAEMPGRDAALP